MGSDGQLALQLCLYIIQCTPHQIHIIEMNEMNIRGCSSIVDPVESGPPGMCSPYQKCTEMLCLLTLVAHKATRIVDERASYVHADVSEQAT